MNRTYCCGIIFKCEVFQLFKPGCITHLTHVQANNRGQPHTSHYSIREVCVPLHLHNRLPKHASLLSHPDGLFIGPFAHTRECEHTNAGS